MAKKRDIVEVTIGWVYSLVIVAFFVGFAIHDLEGALWALVLLIVFAIPGIPFMWFCKGMIRASKNRVYTDTDPDY